MTVRWPRVLSPGSLGGRIALATVALLAIVQALSVAVLVLSRPSPPPVFDPYWLARQLADLASAAAERPPGQRAALLDAHVSAPWLGFGDEHASQHRPFSLSA